ncbi:unnamed protein product [Lactuca virosa]|uniref:Uncharacterized protein n=1 Tax=Lactuca virosa TaxID=75947 RepID=A0AAU9NDV0_9ASTR|nr:unnamed protein product [Lactuca virosa]
MTRTKVGSRQLRDYRKLKAPIFEGDDAFGWIYKVERFFEIQDIGVHDLLKAAAICLDGKALACLPSPPSINISHDDGFDFTIVHETPRNDYNALDHEPPIVKETPIKSSYPATLESVSESTII